MQTKDAIMECLLVCDYSNEEAMREYCAENAADYSPSVFDAELTILMDAGVVHYDAYEDDFTVL